MGLAVFVGAGTTVEAGGPTWRTLSATLLEEAAIIIRAELPHDQNTREEWISHFQNTCCGDLLEVTQIAHDGLGKKFQKTVDMTVSNSYDGARLIPYATSRAIAYLYPDVTEVFTTNFDALLETAFKAERFKHFHSDVFRRVAILKNDEAIHSFAFDRPSPILRIYKLHGAVGSDNVLTDEQYSRSLQNLTALKASWIAGLATKTMLFVGSSMTDIAWRFLRAQMLEASAGIARKVYAVIPQPQSPKRAVDSKPGRYQHFAQSLLLQHWKRMNIHPIWIQDYADVPEIVEEIASPSVEENFRLRKAARLSRRLSDIRRRAGDAEYDKVKQLFDSFLAKLRGKLPLAEDGISANLMLYDARNAKLRIAAASSKYPPPDNVIWTLRLGVLDRDQIARGIRGPQGVSGDTFRAATIKASTRPDAVNDRLPSLEREKLRDHLIRTLVSVPVREPDGVRRLGVINIDLPVVDERLKCYAQSDEGGRYLSEASQAIVNNLAVSLRP